MVVDMPSPSRVPGEAYMFCNAKWSPLGKRRLLSVVFSQEIARASMCTTPGVAQSEVPDGQAEL